MKTPFEVIAVELSVRFGQFRDARAGLLPPSFSGADSIDAIGA
jgi:hypothetical protein